MEKKIIAPQTKANEISLATAVLCLLVVFIHISSQAIVSLDKTSVQWLLVYIPWQASLFVVPGFIFLSAVKMCMKYKEVQFTFKSYVAFVKNRVIVIYIPYAIWVMIYYIHFCNIGYFGFNIKEYLKYLAIGNLSSPFYFIVIIMQFYLLIPIWLYIVRHIKPIASMLIAIMITLFMMNHFSGVISKISAGQIAFEYNDRVFTTYLIYWIFGCYVGTHLEEFKLLINRYIRWIVLITLLLFGIVGSLTYMRFLGVANFVYIENLHMFYCLGAIISLYGVCMYFRDKKNIITAGLYNINKCSFYIYLSHCLVLNIVQEVCVNKQITSIDSLFMIKALFVYGVPIIGSNLYLWIKRLLHKNIHKALEINN
jgi:membrane-bound acyltransferase YfiQ involved in biofilm formation